MSENFYKSIIDNYPVGYAHYKIIYDEFNKVKDYEFVEINKKFKQIIEMDKDKLIGHKVNEVLKDRCDWINFFKNIENNYKDTELEYYIDILDQYYKINLYYPNENNMIMFFVNITKEKKEKEYIELFLDNTETQIWEIQDPLTYGSSNKAHADFLGLEIEDVEFKNLYSIYNQEEAETCIKVNKKIFDRKKKVSTKEWITNSKGERRLVKVLKNPKFNKYGEVEFLSCSAVDITDEYNLEIEKKIKEDILFSMIHFTKELLTNDDHYDALSNGIGMLGNATQVDRVYYWENHYDKKRESWLTSQKIEWCLSGVEKQINNPKLQGNSFEDVDDFIEVLSKNKPFITHIKDMDNTHTKEVLESQGIISILVIPVFINENFHGFIGFDSCRFERDWTDVEISLLKTFVLLYEKAVEKSIMGKYLIQVKKNFDNFFNMVDDFLIVFDKEGIIINANDAVLNKLNYYKDEVIDHSILKFHPKDKTKESKNIMNDILDEKVTHFNSVAISRDGLKIPIETNISKGIWDGEDVLFAVSKDITELTMSEEKFSRAFNLSGVSMIISTIENGEFVEVNDTFLDLIGYEREDVIGERMHNKKIFREINKKENTRENIREEIKKNKKLYNYEVEIICKENIVKTGLCNIVSITINNKPYFLTSIVDITESKLMNKKLAKAKKESDEANKAKSQFLSHMSHEIRTPMNAVIGYSDLLASTILTEKQEDYIEGIKASTGMLMSIINDILDWSEVENEGVELENRSFNIERVINSVVEQQKFKNFGSVNKNVEIIVEKGQEIPDVLYGDYLRIQQILLNLLSNAVKFTEKGYIKIKVELRKRKKDKVTLGFKVEDTGIGIPEELIEDIFTPFKQAENRITSNHRGTGLGLAISKKMVDLMNGEIGLKSKVNEGTTFFFEIDFETKATEGSFESEADDVYHKDNNILFEKLVDKKILAVDDNEINRDVLKSILEDVGIIVTLADSGKEAIEKIKVEEFDVILMDLRMPDMDGYETTREIQKITKTRELPIIAVSASVSNVEMEKCIESNIYEFVTKQ